VTITFTIRTLGSVPWPNGLGKLQEYPGLLREMRRLLGQRWRDPAANQRAFESAATYRAIAQPKLAKAR
jgi:hypothetical protein